MLTKQFFLCALSICASLHLFAQSTWKILPSSPGASSSETRIDDVFFLNKLEGWCATGGGNIYHTADGGTSWTKQLSVAPSPYFRCIEFRNAQLGFAGTLDKKLYRSTNGGNSWTNIAANITPIPNAVCGLSIPTDSTVYAVGQWNEPAFLLKSNDAGLTWINKSMATQAKGLVEVLFTSRDTGWVAGMGIGGATILHTVDGGATFTELFNSGFSGEYVWKLQRVTPLVWVGSIQTMSNNGRMVKSTDGGLTWTTIPAPISDMQGIGFATPLRGWVGDYNSGFYETNDGGNTWAAQLFGGNYNRFYFLDSTFAYASGNRVYKFSPESSSTIETDISPNIDFDFDVNPNPATGQAQVLFNLAQPDNIRISLLSVNGVELRNLHKGRYDTGKHSVQIDITDIPSGPYLIWMQRNHGLFTKPFVVR
ncbi:MAG: hypothetical protein RIR11_4367 [Bacteroidota bacterium]|jgi:photosystem II stability/assembly factor-like uncharacterized protein